MVLDATSTRSISAASSMVASSDSSYEDSDGSNSEDEGTARKSQKSRFRRSSQSSDGLTVNNPDKQLGREKRSKIGRRLHIGHLLKMVLQDAQTRLFFKAQAFVQSEIRQYVPTADDLKWPDILLGTPVSWIIAMHCSS